MKKTKIWIVAAACAVLLCGCSHTEETGALPSVSKNTAAVESQEEPRADEGNPFSESKPGSEPAESKTPGQPPLKEESAEQPSSVPAKESPESKAEGAGSASSSQPRPNVPEGNEQRAETTTPPKPEEPPAPTQPVEPDPPQPTEPPAPAFDVNRYVGFAQSYGQGLGLSLDSTATACWDDPLTANSGSVYLERDLRDRLDWYAASGFTVFCVWAEDAGGGNYLIYIGYA